MTKTNTHITMKPIYEGDLPPIVSHGRTSEQVERANRLEAAHAYAVRMEKLQPALNSSTYDKAYALAASAPALLEALEACAKGFEILKQDGAIAMPLDNIEEYCKARTVCKMARGEV